MRFYFSIEIGLLAVQCQKEKEKKKKKMKHKKLVKCFFCW